MKYFFNLMFILILFLNNLRSQESKINIAVLDLDPTNILAKDAQFLSDRLRTELFETGMFQVIERDKMQNILEEQGFQMSGCTSVECAVEVGQLLNVQQMVAGTIGKIEDLYSISLRLIDVKTGAILKTATKDFRGTLSAVLTDVIPSVAFQLADQPIPLNKNPVRSPVKDEPKTGPDRPSKFSILLRGGLAGINFISNLNDAVDQYNSTYADSFSVKEADKYPAFNNFGLELQYSLRTRLTLKIGLASENMFSGWAYDESNYANRDNEYKDIYLERKFQLVNIYAGLNYKFWQNPQRYAFYLGTDLGLIHLISEYYEEYRLNDTDYAFDNSYTYNKLMLKLILGFNYFLGRHFIVGAEITGQYVSAFDSSQEYSDFEYYPTEFEDIMYPENLNATGVQLNIILGYLF